MSKITNDDNPVWHRMLYIRNHMGTVSVKGMAFLVLMCC